MNLLTGSMTPEQFQQYQQEQQQAFFRWQQSQIINRDLDNLQQNPPSFHSESSQTLTQPQQADSPKKGGRKKKMARKGKNVEDEPQEPVAAGRWLPVEEELLATCYVAVSEDNNVGSSILRSSTRLLTRLRIRGLKLRAKIRMKRVWLRAEVGVRFRAEAWLKWELKLGGVVEVDEKQVMKSEQGTVSAMACARTVVERRTKPEGAGSSKAKKDARAIKKLEELSESRKVNTQKECRVKPLIISYEGARGGFLSCTAKPDPLRLKEKLGIAQSTPGYNSNVFLALVQAHKKSHASLHSNSSLGLAFYLYQYYKDTSNEPDVLQLSKT
ncbi:hypothetical protein Tco_1117356 [Tanacetum coccineum]